MKKIIKILFIFIVIIVFILGFSASYLSLSINDLAYVFAIGIDKSGENNFYVTFQFSTTTPTSESGSTEKSKPITVSVTASSISSAINLADSYIGREINLSHCKVIIFSEEIAKQGISNEIYTLVNNTQIRPSANIIVTKCSAEYYIKKTEPTLESLISKYYETLTKSNMYTGFMPNTNIGDFFKALNCKTCEPYAILGGITSQDSSQTNTVNSQKDFNIEANSSAIKEDNKTQNVGVAVFKDDQLVGELNAIETIAFQNVHNEVDRFLISVPDPFNDNDFLDIYLSPALSTKVKVDTSTKSPYIMVEFNFTGRIFSMTEDSKYLEEHVLDSISNSCNSYLQSTFSNYFYRTSKEFKSDINGFGRFASKNFFTSHDLDSYNWPESYKDSFFDVKVNTTIKSGMLISET